MNSVLENGSLGLVPLESDGNTSFLRAARAGHLDKVLEHLKSNIDINTSNANGLNALHLASKDGHLEVVAELLKRGAAVDAATKKGNTALHIASLAGQEEVVKLLVNHGASVNVQSQNGFTPLYMAAQENHDNVVKYLLANGANQTLATEDGFTPLAVAMQQGHDKVVTVLLENDTRGKVRLPALHIAAKKDDVKAAKLLLENDHNPDVTSKSGFTPLHIASHYGNEGIANLLVQKKADVNYAAKHNITPLHVAAKWGKTNMVAMLLEKGANIESKTRDGLTPLHCAARSGHEQVVDMLLERDAPISCKTKNGLAPLHMAAQGDHVDAARILLYHRAPVDEVTVDYLTALHVAAHCGHVRVAKLLLDRQADANARALNGFTPLHIACKKNRIKVVELLLKHGASISATTESGLTPLHVASFMGCMNIVIYLLQHDANPDVPTVRGETPLHLAARANQTDIIRILLRNGSQVDARAREQQTPLHIASRLGNVDIVMLLLQHGAKVDTATKDMYTALHIAAKEGQDEVAAVLIENGASLNSTTKKGFTPLHLASKYGNIKVAKLLLQKEAPVDAQGKNGVTPLHVASHYDHQQVALLLLDKGASPHATAKNGHTPLHIAAKKNQMDIANTLLEYGAKPNAESKAGFTPLHLSAQEGHVDMTSLLIEHEADTNCQAKNGLTPLHLCAQEDRVPVAEVLVKNKATVDKASKAGYTPLHVACHYGQSNMVRFLLNHGADVTSTTTIGYTPLHQAAQQGHTNIVNVLLENSAQPNAITHSGQTPLHIAQKLGYISVIDTLKLVTQATPTTPASDEKYKVVAPEAMHETFMSDSEEEGGEDTMLGDNAYRYLTADEMKSLGDDSLPIDVTRDERIDSNRLVTSGDSNLLPPQAIEDSISPQQYHNNYSEYIKKYTPDNVDIARHPINIGFLVSFLVDARGGAMRGCRHSGVRVIVPPRSAGSPTRITCRYVRPQRTPHPPPLMEGEALASRVLELGPVGAKFLGPVIIEVPHFAALRGKEREIVILRSDNGETWREHTVDSSEDILNDVLSESFEAEDISQLEDVSSGRITRILTHDFPQYFAVVSRIRQEVHAIGPEGGMVSSTVVPQVQAVFPQGALTKKIKVGLQAQPIDPELTAKLLGHGVAVSPVVTVEPRRRKFHKAITLSMPAPRAHSQGMINQYSGSTPTLRLLCSITGGTTRAQWEDVTGSTPLTFVNDCVSFTTTVSARFWLMDCRNIGDATKMATELYREAIHVPFMAKFVVFAKRIDPLEARLRVFCMTDDKEDKTLEHQEHFTEVAKSRDVEVLEGKSQYVEFAGNLIPITKSGEQLQFAFRAFRENRLPFSVKVKDQHAEAIGRSLFMRESKVPKGDPPQQPICILNIVLPDDIVADTISLTDSDSIKRHEFLKDSYEYYRPDPRLADISNLLGEDWVLLATQLGLTTSEINVIKSEYLDSVAKQAQSMLRMWISQSSNRSQSIVLENALRRIGREDIIPQCLNEEPDIIKKEETVKYRIKKDISFEDRDIMKDSESVESLIQNERKEDKIKKRGSYDKYSAEEKVVEEPSDEEDFSKTVREKRELIEKRLSVERTIPASSQRVEIAQEISSIKRQSIVEDKIAEVETQKRLTPPETKTIEENLPVESDIYVTTEKTIVEEITPEKQTTTTTVVTETRTIKETVNITHKTEDERNDDLLENVAQRLETKKVIPNIVTDADPRSPKLSKTPPPSPADFNIKEKAATVQEWEASREDTEEDAVLPLRIKTQENIGLTSPAAKVKTEDSLDIVKADTHVDKLDYEKNVENTSNIKPQLMPKTDSKEIPIKIKSNMEVDPNAIKVEDKKERKGIINTLKSFVSKSFDQSDSESDRSQAKDTKGKKKQKKSKSKSQLKSNELIKPRLPTPPLKEPEHFKNLPFVEVSPNADDNQEVQFFANESEVIKIFMMDVKESIQEIEDAILKEIKEDGNKKSTMNMYNNDTKPVTFVPENLLNEAEDLLPDVKLTTHNLIQNEMCFQGWVDDKDKIKCEKSNEVSKPKSKPIRIFGFLTGKSSKDTDVSEDDSEKQKDVIEKQDKEDSKEIEVIESESKNTGLFDIFSKKGKKDFTKSSSKEVEDISDPTGIIKNTNDFIDIEIKNYDLSHDQKTVSDAGKLKSQHEIEGKVKKRDKKEKSKEPEKRRSGILTYIFGKEDDRIENETNENLTKDPNPDKVLESSAISEHDGGNSSNIENTKHFLTNEIDQYGNSKDSKNEQENINEVSEGPIKSKKGVFNIFAKKDKTSDEGELQNKQSKNNINELQAKKKIKSPLAFIKKEKQQTKLPESVLKDINECNDFLKLEVDNYFDERLLSVQKTDIESNLKPTDSPKKDHKKGIFNIFAKKERNDNDIGEQTILQGDQNLIDDTSHEKNETTKNKTGQFLYTEILNYDCSVDSKCKSTESKESDSENLLSKKITITDDDDIECIVESKEIRPAEISIKVNEPISKSILTEAKPESEIKLRNDTEDFLKAELLNYHDVKSNIPIKVSSKSKGKYIFCKSTDSSNIKSGKAKSKAKKDSSDSADESDSQIKSSKFGIFKKKEKAPPVTELIKETDSSELPFSHTEIKITDSSNIKSGKDKKKPKRESSDSADESESQMKSSKFGIFKKKEKTQPVSELIQEANSSENLLLNTSENVINTKDELLQDEKNVYTNDNTNEVSVNLTSPDVKKATFKHKKTISSESGDESDSCTKSSKFRLFSKPKKSKSVDKNEENVVYVDKSYRDDSISFLKTELKHYFSHPVESECITTSHISNEQPNNIPEEVNDKTQSNVTDYSEDGADESEKVAKKEQHKMFSKKNEKKQHHKSKISDKEDDKINLNKLKKGESSESGEESDGSRKSSKYKLFSRKKKADREKVSIKEASSKELLAEAESLTENKIITKDFLNEEVKRYEDVKLVYPPKVVVISPIESIEDKKTKFNLINKLIKKTKKENTGNAIELSEDCLLNMSHAKEFLTSEITHYEDVKLGINPNDTYITDEKDALPVTEKEAYKVFDKIYADNLEEEIKSSISLQEQQPKFKHDINNQNERTDKLSKLKLSGGKNTDLPSDILVSHKNTEDFLAKEVSLYNDSHSDGKSLNKSHKVGDTFKKEVTFQTDQTNTLKDVLTTVDLKSSTDNSEISQKTILVKTIVFNSAQEVLDSSTDVEKNEVKIEEENQLQENVEETKSDVSQGKKKKGIFNKIFFGKSKEQTPIETSASKEINNLETQKDNQPLEKNLTKKSKGFLFKIGESVEKIIEPSKESLNKESKEEEKESNTTFSNNIDKPENDVVNNLGQSEQLTDFTNKQTSDLLNKFLDNEKYNVSSPAKDVSGDSIKETKNEESENLKVEETDHLNKKKKSEKKKKIGIFDKIFSGTKSKSKDKPDQFIPDIEKAIDTSTQLESTKTSELAETLKPIEEKDISTTVRNVDKNLKDKTVKFMISGDKFDNKIQETASHLESEILENIKSVKDSIDGKLKQTKEISATIKSDFKEQGDSIRTNNITDKLDDALNGLKTVKEDFESKIIETKRTITSEVEKRGDDLKSSFDDALEDRKAKLETKITDSVSEIEAQVSSKVENITDCSKEKIDKLVILESLEDSISGKIQRISTTKEVSSIIKSDFKNFEDSIKTKNITENLSDTFSDLEILKEDFESKISTSKITITSEVEKRSKALESSFKDEIKESKSNLETKITNSASEVEKSFSSKVGNIADGFKENINKLVTQENIENVKDSLDGKVQEITTTREISSTIRSDFKELEDSIKSKKIAENLKDTVGDLKTVTEDFESKINEKKTTITSEVKKLSEDLKSSFDNDVKESKLKLETKITNSVSDAEKPFSTKVENITDGFNKKIDKLVENIKSVKDSTDGKVQQITTTTETSSTIKSDIKELGESNKTKNITEKLKDTVSDLKTVKEDFESKISETKTTITSEVKKISEGLKSSFDDEVKESKSKLETKVTNLVSEVIKPLSSKVENIADDSKEIIQESLKYTIDPAPPSSITGFKEDVSIKLGEVYDDCKDKTGKIFRITKSLPDQLKESKSQLQGSIISDLSMTTNKLLDKCSEVISSNENAKVTLEDINFKSESSTGDCGLSKMKMDSATLEKTFDKTDSLIKDTTITKINEDISSTIKDLKHNIDKLEDSSKLVDVKLKEDTNKLLTEKQNFTENITKTATDLQSINDSLTSKVSPALEKLEDTSEKIVKEIKKTESKLKSDIKQKLETAQVSLTSSLVDVEEMFKNETQKLLTESSRDKITEIKPTIKSDLQNTEIFQSSRIGFDINLENERDKIASNKEKRDTSEIDLSSKVMEMKSISKSEIDSVDTSSKLPTEGSCDKSDNLKIELKGAEVKLDSDIKCHQSTLKLEFDNKNKVNSYDESTSSKLLDQQNSKTKNEDDHADEKKRSPIFRIESEEEVVNISIDRRDSIKSNILETISDERIGELVTGLESFDNSSNKNKITNLALRLNTKEETFDNDNTNKTEKKLKRVEKKFERMASESIEQENSLAKQLNISSPEMENKRDSEFQVVISQLSTEEVADLQDDYSTLWDEQTFSHTTEEWDSKTPESQAEVIDLPQGETSTSGPRSLTGKKSGPQVEADESNVGTTSRSVITEDKESKQARKLKEEKDKE